MAASIYTPPWPGGKQLQRAQWTVDVPIIHQWTPYKPKTPSAAQERRETGRAQTSPAWAPRCAAEPAPVAATALPVWQAASSRRALLRTS